MTVLLIVSVVLLFILVGFILLPISILISVLASVAWSLLPFAAGVLSIPATVAAMNGKIFEYPYIGREVSKWLRETSPETPIAV